MSHSLQKQSVAVRLTVWDPEQKISLAVVLCNRRASYHVAHNNVSKKRLTPFQTALFTAVDVARRVLDQSAGDKLRSMPLLSGGWPKRLMMTHNKRTTSHIKASDHYAARMNESRWQTNTAVPFLLVLNFGEQFVCNKRDNCGLVGGKSKKAHWLVWSGNLAGMCLQSIGFPLCARLKQ